MSDDLQFTVPRAPQFGELTDLLPGMYWVRLPLPLTMNHINCWLLDNGPGWTLIDCGMNTDDIFEIWDKLWRGLLRARPLQNLTLTHAHIDHIGLAGFLVKEHKCAVQLTLAEWLNGWLMWHERDEGINDVFVDYMKRNGASDEEAKAIAAAQRPSKFPGVRPPREFTRMRDGEIITMGKREWRVIIAGGHSVEHASFFCEKDRILIAGDQVLSHITPSIIVSSAQPDSNPMQDYLDSMARFEALPPDTLVLPSHGLPFHGLHTRIAQLREHHAARLDDMASMVTERVTPFAIAAEIFSRLLLQNPRQAFGETLAHLNMLVARGKLKREVDDKGNVSFAPM
jgi:glyoxylase-like metal-dependent hydrolase (beta-lactamase superfamily II)